MRKLNEEVIRMQDNYSKLRGRIKEKYGTQTAFSQAMGMNYTTLSYKLNDKSEWNGPEIAKACELLDIPPQEIPIFFNF